MFPVVAMLACPSCRLDHVEPHACAEGEHGVGVPGPVQGDLRDFRLTGQATPPGPEGVGVDHLPIRLCHWLAQSPPSRGIPHQRSENRGES